MLCVTEEGRLKRSESLLDPDLFKYHRHFEFLGLLGKTHLSEVYRVRHRESGDLYAVKRSRRRFRSKLQRERCLREIQAVAALPPHPHIVGQYRAWQENGHFYIQMDLCEGGSLQHLVRSVSGRVWWGPQCWAAGRSPGVLRGGRATGGWSSLRGRPPPSAPPL